MKTFRISFVLALALMFVLAGTTMIYAEGPKCAPKDNAQCKAVCEKMNTDSKCTMQKGDNCCTPEACAKMDCAKGSPKCTPGSADCCPQKACDKAGKQCKPGEAAKPAPPSDGKEKS